MTDEAFQRHAGFPRSAHGRALGLSLPLKRIVVNLAPAGKLGAISGGAEWSRG